MNKNINVEICKCGTIHVVHPEKFLNALDRGANYLKVCRNCGATTVMGECTMEDEDGNEIPTLYDVELPDDRCSITLEDFDASNDKKIFSEIYFSHGYKVPMMSGGYATGFKNSSFCEDYPRNTRSHELAMTVNMNKFIEETPDEILEAVSRLWIEGLDWTGTKYEKNVPPKVEGVILTEYGPMNNLPYMTPYEIRKYRVDITPKDYSDVVNYGF